jgi:hypothetical protein
MRSAPRRRRVTDSELNSRMSDSLPPRHAPAARLRSDMSDDVSPQQHAFSHAPAALRIFRFAADTAPRVLELAHVSAFLRECAVEFGSADATLPGALRNEYARGRFFWLRAAVERNAERCPWLAAKVLACRSGAPVPAAALAPDVTRHDVNWGDEYARRHDVNWGAEGARRHASLAVSEGGSALRLTRQVYALAWAQRAVGVTSGKHWFSVSITRSVNGWLKVGWVDRALRTGDDRENGPGSRSSPASGANFMPWGLFHFGTAPLSADQFKRVPGVVCPCTLGCLLDADAGVMTVFVDGEPLDEQCDYTFPTDREWFPTVGLSSDALFSNAA